MFAIDPKIDPKQMRIALIAGGTSGERDVSLASAAGSKGALEEAGYTVTQLDPADKNSLIELVQGGFDVAFMALHGKGGEDGTMQGFLELIDLPYTGSGVFGSAVSIDKSRAKVFYENAGIPTAASVTLSKGQVMPSVDIVTDLGQKCVVKAATEGSSIGVYIVEGEEALEAAINEALAIDDKVVIESYKKGREFTVVVLDGIEENGDTTTEATEALPIIEIIPKNASYDFESKYAPGGSEHICPADLPGETTTQMQEYAVMAHKALGCHGVSRTDFILEEDGQMWALETNTIPGMTPTSLLPDAARAAGISFPDLCTIMIQSALKKSGRI